jgi:hypothetical protein
MLGADYITTACMGVLGMGNCAAIKLVRMMLMRNKTIYDTLKNILLFASNICSHIGLYLIEYVC